MVKCLFREPLLHFLLLGAGLFLAFGFMPKDRSSGSQGKIVITRGRLEQLVSGFTKTWQRAPTPEELEGLVRDQVREEVYFREAIALGLDRDDTVIRRRLRQKMEFMADDIASQIEPSDADLSAYLAAHPDLFRIEPQFTFRQVYLNPERHGEKLARDTAQLLGQLNQSSAKGEPPALGDPFLLGDQFTSVPAGEIVKQFGQAFAAKLGALAIGQWQGPVESGFGVHLVCVSQRTESRLPVLAEVRDAVRRGWETARRLEANEQYYQKLLKRYTLTIESLEPAAGKEKGLAKAR